MSRTIPIVMSMDTLGRSPSAAEAMDGRERPLSDAARAHAASGDNEHKHDGGGDRSVLGAAPIWIRVGDATISEADVAREMQHHRAADPHRAREDAARALVVRELLRLEVERLGMDGGSLREGDETAEEASVRVLLEREVVTPTPEEADCWRYFEQNRERLHEPDRVRVRHILLAAPPADAGARARACELGERLIEELREHPDRFTEFALRHSACPSRDEGGELGWIGRGDTVPEFERQLFMLKPGLAGLTLETRYGHHVVRVDEVQRGSALEFAQAAGRIATYLEAQARQNGIHQYLQILVERYGVTGLDATERGSA